MPLEAALNTALVAVPHYVLDTLLGMALPFHAQRPVPNPSPSRHTQPSFDLVSAQGKCAAASSEMRAVE